MKVIEKSKCVDIIIDDNDILKVIDSSNNQIIINKNSFKDILNFQKEQKEIIKMQEIINKQNKEN